MKKIITLASIILIFSSCLREDQVDLTNRYFRSAEILSLPALNYDSDNSPPDLRVDLKRRSAGFWEFSTYTEINAGTLPAFMVFPAEILGTDEVWQLRIVDEDPNELQDDEIFFWEFHALEDGAAGSIEFYDSGNLVLVLNFNER